MSAASDSAGSGRPPVGLQERTGHVLGVGAAAAVAEREQPTAGSERVRHRLCTQHELCAVPVEDLLAQLHDLLSLGDGGAAHLREHAVEIGVPGVQEGVEGLDAVAR